VSYYKQLKTKLKQTKGFTLIELLVVIAIIGILSSVVLASLNGARESSRDARRQTDLSQIQTGLALYNDQNGEYPTSLYGSGDTLEDSDAMTQVPTDPSDDSQYEYTTSTSNSGADFCLGANLENTETKPDDNSSECIQDLGGTSTANYAISG